MAAKRAEMMENARSRDEERVRNVKRYREDDARERLRTEKSAAAAGFVQYVTGNLGISSITNGGRGEQLSHVQQVRRRKKTVLPEIFCD